MPAQDNTTLAQAIYQAFNDNDLDAALAYVAADIELVLMPFDQHFYGLEGFRDFMQGFKLAFPDCTVNLINQVATENGVVNEFMARGTHTGPLSGPNGQVPATGRNINYPVCEVWEIKDGKLTKLRNYFDTGTLRQQLGLS